MINETIRLLTYEVDASAIHNKMLETEIAQQASISSKPLRKLPSKPKTNPKEHYKAITILSGNPIEEP